MHSAASVFVGSGIFLSEDPLRRGRAIVQATTCWEDSRVLAEVSTGLGAPMRGLELSTLAPQERLAGRGW
jgi:pyridoxal 5'-phosphate synthase pdxS subunit